MQEWPKNNYGIYRPNDGNHRKIAEIAGHGLDVLNVEIFAVSGASGTLVHAGFL